MVPRFMDQVKLRKCCTLFEPRLVYLSSSDPGIPILVSDFKNRGKNFSYFQLEAAQQQRSHMFGLSKEHKEEAGNRKSSPTSVHGTCLPLPARRHY